jgi:hypothetical protein
MFRYFDNVLAISNSGFGVFLFILNNSDVTLIIAIVNTAILILRNLRRVYIEIFEIYSMFLSRNKKEIDDTLTRWKEELKPEKNDASA